MCLQEAYERCALATHYAELDDSIAEHEAIDAIADQIWDREVGTPIRGAALAEALTEVLATYDHEDMQLLMCAAFVGDAHVGTLLMGQARDYLEASCREKAREQLERDKRLAEAEAVADRMAA